MEASDWSSDVCSSDLFLDGQIAVRTESGSELWPVVEQIFEQVQAELNVPLVYSLNGQLEKLPPVVEEVKEVAAPETELTENVGSIDQTQTVTSSEIDSSSKEVVLGDLVIVGITLKPMRFISAQGGLRLFEGSVLPDGREIVSISSETITLGRNGQTEIFHLGISAESINSGSEKQAETNNLGSHHD
jgi:hypothetical protein